MNSYVFRLVLFVFALPATCLTAQAAENPLQGVFSAENLKKAGISGVDVSPGPRPDSVVLRFPSGEKPGSIMVPVPAAARDWTPYGAFTFEFRSDSTIRWDLQIRNAKGQVFSYRVQPYENVPVRAAIPASFLFREYMNNRQFKGHWLSNWGNHIELAEVESLTIRMSPNRPVTLTLGPLALVRDIVADEVFIAKPVADEFGQWIGTDWPGKARSVEGLQRAWKAEDAGLKKSPDYSFCAYGGWKERKERATGFFHTAEVDGRWWLVDPDGHLFFSSGPDCVRYRDGSRVKGREMLFSKLPPGTGETVEFYRANALLRHGEADFVAKWKAKTVERLRAWGFNTVANWSDPAMFEKPGLPFVVPLNFARGARNWRGFPDVYSDESARAITEEARAQCAALRNQPQLIGYFIGNEPRWPYRNVLDAILSDPQPSATQSFVREFLREKGDTPATREALMETISRRYFGAVVDAIRKADPNHLVLGIRWAGQAPDPVLRANEVFDVFSINIYRFEPPADQIRRIYGLVKKPILLGEFHFGAAERGYAPSLVMVSDQTERGIAFQYYMEKSAALAPIVGAHYFQFVDQPVTGRFDGENYNLGFVTQTDLPYPEMVSFAAATHRRMYAIHAGRLAPTDRMSKVR